MHKQTDVTMVDSAAYSPKGIGVSMVIKEAKWLHSVLDEAFTLERIRYMK